MASGPQPDAGGEPPNSSSAMRWVDLEFERFSRLTLTYGEQLTGCA